MERRKALKIGIGALAGTGISFFTLTNAFRNKDISFEKPNKLEYDPTKSNNKYVYLDPEASAELAYEHFSNGGCMYAVVSSIVSQLAEKIGEPYMSFPLQMFVYGHGGIGGYGSVCGTLNGAAAVISLFVNDWHARDSMIVDIFQWYEKTSLPVFKPLNPKLDFAMPSVISNSVLCHASNTKWCNKSGFTIDSNERKERCRCLTADVTKRLTVALNEIFSDTYIANINNNIEKNTCLACHGAEGKIKNSKVKMQCNSCHSESVGHKVFSDAHYKFMNNR